MKIREHISLLDGDFGILKKHTVLFDDEMALINIPANKSGDETVKLEWVTLVMVVSGSAVCTINEKEVQICTKDLLLCVPNSVLRRGQQTEDFQCRCLCFSRSFLEKSVTYSVFNWDVMSFLVQHPVLTLTDKEYELFSLFYSMLNFKLENQQTICYREATLCLVKSFLYELYAVLDRYVSVEQQAYSLGHNLFKKFLDLLSSSYPKPRSVSFYAGELNVTPKYLSTVCKQHCGQTASNLINKFVMNDISYLLEHSNKSIKEIMVELEFPSLSFFGKYVKKHFGMGPRSLRAARLS